MDNYNKLCRMHLNINNNCIITNVFEKPPASLSRNRKLRLSGSQSPFLKPNYRFWNMMRSFENDNYWYWMKEEAKKPLSDGASPKDVARNLGVSNTNTLQVGFSFCLNLKSMSKRSCGMSSLHAIS